MSGTEEMHHATGENRFRKQRGGLGNGVFLRGNRIDEAAAEVEVISNHEG